MKILKRPRLSLWERLYFPAILKGMALTFSHIFRKRVTLQYPEERWTLPGRYRGAPVLLTGLDGHEKCTSCKLCQFICPPKAIAIVAGETPLEKALEFIRMITGVEMEFEQGETPELAVTLGSDGRSTGAIVSKLARECGLEWTRNGCKVLMKKKLDEREELLRKQVIRLATDRKSVV